jgi:2-hydroxy-3-keto-5-methylthiopentenyl-1-phosphate phosphatase
MQEESRLNRGIISATKYQICTVFPELVERHEIRLNEATFNIFVIHSQSLHTHTCTHTYIYSSCQM